IALPLCSSAPERWRESFCSRYQTPAAPHDRQNRTFTMRCCRAPLAEGLDDRRQAPASAMTRPCAWHERGWAKNPTLLGDCLRHCDRRLDISVRNDPMGVEVWQDVLANPLNRPHDVGVRNASGLLEADHLTDPRLLERLQL